MAVVSLKNYRPSARYDATPWKFADILEAPDTLTGPGTFATIGAPVTLTPVDADPTKPASRNFTTVAASAQFGYWYKVQFRDDAGNTQLSSASFSAEGSAALPTVDDIREQSNVEWAEYGYAPPAPGEPDRLEPVLDEAIVEFISMTGIDITNAEAMTTDKRIELIRKAIRMLVEFNTGSSQMEVVESVVDFDIIASFGAAGYNETRRNVSANAQIVHPWPALNRLLKFIVYFDSAGAQGYDTPEVLRPGLEPKPGSWIMDAEYPFGMFDPPIMPDVAHLTYGA